MSEAAVHGFPPALERLYPSRFVTIELASVLTGLTESAIRMKIHRGVWLEDRQWVKRDGGPCLKRLGIRYRSPYETRHTYATMMLMQGVTPAFAARQMGHSVEMFLRTYARWIDGGQNAVEMAKLEALFSRGSPRSSEKAS